MYILGIEISKKEKGKGIDPYIHIWTRGRGGDFIFYIPYIGEIKKIECSVEYVGVLFHNGEKIIVDDTYNMTFRNTVGGSVTQNVQLYPVHNMWDAVKEYRKTREIMSA